MSSLWGAQPPLVPKLEWCRCPPYEVLSLHSADTLPSLPVPGSTPHQATSYTLLTPPVPSSSSFSFSLSLPSPRSTPACVLHKCWVAGSPPYEVTGSWGGQATSCTCVSDYVSSSFTVLYSTVFTLLQSPSILLYCILFPVTLYSHINFTKGTITHKQTNLLYSHYCTVLYC